MKLTFESKEYKGMGLMEGHVSTLTFKPSHAEHFEAIHESNHSPLSSYERKSLAKKLFTRVCDSFRKDLDKLEKDLKAFAPEFETRAEARSRIDKKRNEKLPGYVYSLAQDDFIICTCTCCMKNNFKSLL